MATKQEQEDEDEGGDLGLGRGLKPGAIALNTDDSCCDDQFTMLVKTHLPPNTQHNSKSRRLSERLSAIPGIPFATKNQQKTGKDSTVVNSDSEKSQNSSLYTEVPLDKSNLLHQRQILEEKIQQIFQESQSDGDFNQSETPGDAGKKGSKTSQQKAELALQKKLKKAEIELEQLRQDLELCRTQLEAKYRAISIMQKQSFAVHTQQLDTTKKTKQMNRKLIKELNRVQFELEHKQETLVDSQELWSERFDRVCLENLALMATIESRSQEMKKITNEKLLLRQERDELLALLDIQERHRYEFAQSMSISSDEDQYSGFTSAELSVLGACRCRVKSPEPCCCALLAAQMRKEIVRLKEQVEVLRHEKGEAQVTTDAYRIAFEEQLAQNRMLMQQIAELSTASPQMKQRSKLKAALKWIIQQLNEDDAIMLIPGLRLPPGVVLQNGLQPAKAIGMSSTSLSDARGASKPVSTKSANKPLKAAPKSEVKPVPAVPRSEYQPLATKPDPEAQPLPVRSRADDATIQEKSQAEIQPLLEKSLPAGGTDGSVLPSEDVDGEAGGLSRQPSSDSLKFDTAAAGHKPSLVTWKDVKRQVPDDYDGEADKGDGLNVQLTKLIVGKDTDEVTVSSEMSSEFESLSDSTEPAGGGPSQICSLGSSSYSSCDNLALSDTNSRTELHHGPGPQTTHLHNEVYSNGLDTPRQGDGCDRQERSLVTSSQPSLDAMREVIHSKNIADINKLVDSLSNQSEKHLMATLIEMISDRSEALAHQRLATRMLAIRTQELEHKLKSITEEVFDVPHEPCVNSIT